MSTYQEALQETLHYFGGNELSANTVVSKYLLKTKTGDYLETSPQQLHERMAREFARIETKFGGHRAVSYDTILSQFDHFSKIIPQGSPQYGIGNNEQIISLSNCVVVGSPQDNMPSIMEKAKDLASLFQRRCGVGLDLSELRPENMPVSNSAGTTSGAWSFADFYSYVCRMIGQNGRRGAEMLSMDVRHPDIFKFVSMKATLDKVTGANVSVRIRDDFMEAVVADTEYTLQFPVDSDTPTCFQVIKARDLWDHIVAHATKSAEPGLLFWDTILKTLPAECYADVGFKTVGVNPCSELSLSADDSCRLITLNLVGFVRNAFTANAYFDMEAFRETVSIAMRLSDDLVELEIEKIEKLIAHVDTDHEKILWGRLLKSCVNGRRTGLGTLGLGDTLLMLGLTYGSDESLPFIESVYEALRDGSYLESAKMAQERGSFLVYDYEKEKGHVFISSLPQATQDMMRETGRRNISLLTGAPTGSTAMEACFYLNDRHYHNVTSGIEPVFRYDYTRRKKINPSDIDAVVNYTDSLGDKWSEFKVYHPALRAFYDMYGEDAEIPSNFVSSDTIGWLGGVKVQAAIQKYTDHSLSKTTNLPAGTLPSVVSGIYIEAWKRGLKGITVYVDGSRSGVLITDKDKKTETLPVVNAAKRPDTLPCEIHHRVIKPMNKDATQWTILVGLLDGKPYEVFAGPAEYIEIPEKYTSGTLVKHNRKTMNARYDLTYGENGAATTVKNIIKWFDDVGQYGTMSRLISMSLRHGVPVQYVVEQLQKDESDDMWSFNRVVARVLKTHIPDGIAYSDKVCSSCKQSTLIYQDGCVVCTSCAHSKCN
jgi:ribonucleoside-diphosphate reductase alpha chain